MRLPLVHTLGLLFVISLLANLSAAEPQWIWSAADAAAKAEPGETIFRKTFSAEQVAKAELLIACDNRFELFLNGRRLGAGEGWASQHRADLKPLLVPGRNIVAVRAVNDGPDPAGLMVRIELSTEGQKEPTIIATDKSWKFSRTPLGNWNRVEFDDSKWSPAAELGPYGKTPPWGAAGQVVALTTGSNIAANSPAAAANREPGLFQLRDGDRIALLGGAFIERMNTFGYFETALTAAYPKLNFTVRNLGWSGDNVWGDARAVFGSRADGFKRLIHDTTATKPTVLLVCYGENEAHAGEAGLGEFIRGYEQLLTALEPTGARFVLIAPRKHENLGGKLPKQDEYNAQLKLYRDAIAELAAARSFSFIDLGDALWSADPKSERLTENGVHLSGYGEWRFAAELVKRLGGRPPVWQVDLDLEKNALAAIGTAVSDLTREGHDLKFQLSDATLPLPPLAAEYRPSGKNVPPQQQLRIRGLAAGKYELRLRGVPVQTFTHTELAAGVSLSDPQAAKQAEKLRSLVLKKNELFFHRHRPQNETYLFLFRKHEQGNNAVEIPLFDPLIQEVEKEIAQQKSPLKYTAELKLIGS